MSIIAFDTNILVYAVDQLAYTERREKAQFLLDRAAQAGIGFLSSQTLVEFHAVVTRKKRGTAQELIDQIELWGQLFTVAGPCFDDVVMATKAHRDHGLSIWDAMIWSVSHRAGAHLLLSEDFQDGRVLDGVRFVNPFNPINDPLIETILTP